MPKQNQQDVQSKEIVYAPLDWFVVRAPLFPIEHYFAVGSDQTARNDLVAKALSDPKISTALSVGNPNFYDALKRFNPAKQDADAERLVGKLLRLLIRMSSRCTPMGMYAGLAIGRWEDNTTLQIADTGTRLRTRPDSELMANLVLPLESTLLKHLKLVVNPTTALYANRAYVIEKAAVLKQEDVNGVTIEATPEIRTIMSLARTPISYEELLSRLVASSKIPPTDLEGLLRRLVEITFLLTNLRPSNLAGTDERMLSILNELPEAAEVTERLNRLVDGAKAFDSAMQKHEQTTSEAVTAGNGAADNEAEVYKDLTAEGQAIKTTKSGVSLQTDMQLALSGTTLSKTLLKDIQEMLQILLALGHGTASVLAEYRKRFKAAYEEREVPLLELVNPDIGLGLPSNLESEAGQGQSQVDKTKQVLVTELIHAAIRDGKLEVELTPDVLERLSESSNEDNKPENRQENKKKSPYPLSLDVMVQVIAGSPSDIDSGNYRLCGARLMPGAGRMLGRFAYLLDDESTASLEQLCEREQSLEPRKIFAGISSLPRKLRLGNVSTTPILRPFHIAIDSCTDLTDRTQPLALDDLVVGVRGGRFYLRSISHGAEVTVCAAHVANLMMGTALAKFLQEASLDGVAMPYGFRWGIASEYAFRPRLRYKKFILSIAQWTVKPLPEDRDNWKTDAGFQHWLDSWRQRWFVPRYVYLTRADNRLLLDLENADQANELRRELLDDKKRSLQLEESFVGENDVWVPGPGGRHVAEFVVPFVMTQKQTEDGDDRSKFESTFDPRGVSYSQRLRLPGSNCLYLKLYGGKNFDDELLRTSILNLFTLLLDRNLITSWFFIRYADPDPHLRVRVFGDPQTLNSKVYPLMFQLGDVLCKDLLRKKISIDTYDREVERYGGTKGIELAERLFAADSVFVANLLKLESREAWHEERLNTCAFTVDKLLAALGLDADTRLVWYKPYNTSSKITAGKEYRQRKDALSKLFLSPNSLGDEFHSHMQQWQNKLGGIGAQYAELASSHDLTAATHVIYRSIVHIHCNRMGIEPKRENIALALAERACQTVRSRQKTQTVSVTL